VDINSAVGRKAGLSDEKLLAVRGDDLSLFTDMERLVIELADALSDTPSNVDDGLYARLSQRFSEQQLIELGAQIAFEQYRARLNRLFEVGSDDLYTPGATPSASGPAPQ
jgi:alkylhydroperoxidase family enzyme